MKILALSDVEAKRYYDYYQPGCLDPFDLIIACGDLSCRYLEFITTMSCVPVLYVRGNHDESLLAHPPGGCECIEDRIYVYNGIRFLGLGGSMRYRSGNCMYSEREMKQRIRRLTPSLLIHHGFDVLVTHAPARHLNDLDNTAHKGFDCFNTLIRRFKPKYFIHGHVHRNYAYGIPQFSVYEDTLVVNAYEYAVFEIDETKLRIKK